MALYVDMIVFYLQRAGGISSVWKEILVRFLQEDKDIVLILQNETCHNIYFDEIMSFHPKTIIENSKKARENRYRTVTLSLDSMDKFVSTYYRHHKQKNIKQYVIVHDFTYEYYNHGLKKWVHSWQKKSCVKHSEVIICVSENTKKDLSIFYPWTGNKKIYVNYNAANDIYRKIQENEYIAELENYNYNPFLLFVGSRASYKRFDLAVEIAAAMGYGLVIIGGGRLSKEEIYMLEAKLADAYIHKSGLSDAVLSKIYAKAYALLYPSEYEGFGIPVLEAQLSGCPVVAFRGSSLDEITDISLLLPERNMDDVIQFLQSLVDIKKREQIIRKGRERADSFSWVKTAKQYAEIFEI